MAVQTHRRRAARVDGDLKVAATHTPPRTKITHYRPGRDAAPGPFMEGAVYLSKTGRIKVLRS